MDNTTLHLTIISREKTVFDNDVISVTSYNDTGIFDILPFHANFISVLRNKIHIQTLSGVSQEFFVDHAVLRVKENMVQVFLGTGM